MIITPLCEQMSQIGGMEYTGSHTAIQSVVILRHQILNCRVPTQSYEERNGVLIETLSFSFLRSSFFLRTVSHLSTSERHVSAASPSFFVHFPLSGTAGCLLGLFHFKNPQGIRHSLSCSRIPTLRLSLLLRQMY